MNKNNNTINKGFVVNLKEATQRKQNIINSFKDSSIQLEFVEAVKVKNGENGNIGLGETFKNIIKQNSNLKFILILEDDCKPLENFDKRWKITKKWLDNNPNEWEIFSGGCIVQNSVEIKKKLEENVNIFKMDGDAWCTHWTYINSNAFNKVLDYDFNKHGTIDYYLNSSKYFKVLTIYPLLAVQDGGYSFINKKDKTLNFTNKIMLNGLNKKGGKTKKSTTKKKIKKVLRRKK